jgi:hypothetical protein
MRRKAQSRVRRKPVQSLHLDRVDVGSAVEVAQLLWPEFIQERGATFVAFRSWLCPLLSAAS